MEEKLLNIPIEKIVANKNQPRSHFDNQLLEELALSIKEHGIVQPIVVRALTDNMFEIIAGERRYRAGQIAGLTEIPAVLKSYDEKETPAIALIENIQREDLSAVEEAKAYKKLIIMHNLTQEELSKRLGKSQSTIANKLRLLQLAETTIEKIQTKVISERHGRALLVLKDDVDLQNQALYRIIKKKLNVKETEKIVKKLLLNKDEEEIELEKGVEEKITEIKSELSPQMKLIFNTYEQTNDMVKKMGIEPNVDYRETKEEYVITIKISKD